MHAKNCQSRAMLTAHHYFWRFLGLFGTALAIQISFLSILPNRFRQNDEAIDYRTFYKPVGENILAGKGIVDADGKLGTAYPPGYPTIIALVFGAAHVAGVNQITAIDMFDVLLMAASALLLFAIAYTLFGHYVAYIGFFLWITYPPNLWLIKQPNSEVPFVFFFLLSLLLFTMAAREQRVRLSFVCGLFLGLAALVRPIGVFLFILFAVAAMFCPALILKNRAKMAILIAAGFLFSVLPWEGYLYSKSGQFPLLCTSGPGGMSEGLVFAVEPVADSKPMWVPESLLALMQQASLERPSMKTTGSVLKFVAREAKRNPWGTFELALMKFYRPWYSTYSRKYDHINLSYQLFYIPLGILGLVFGIKRYGSQIYWIGLLLSLVLYFWGMAFLVVPLFRYMIPSMALVVMFCAMAAEALLFHAKSDRAKG